MITTSHVHILVADPDPAVEQELVRVFAQEIGGCHVFAANVAGLFSLPCSIEDLGRRLQEHAQLHRCHIVVVDKDLLKNPSSSDWDKLRTALLPAHCVVHMGNRVRTIEAMRAVEAGVLISPIKRSKPSHRPFDGLAERVAWHHRARQLDIQPDLVLREIIEVINGANNLDLDEGDMRELIEHLFPKAQSVILEILTGIKLMGSVPRGHSVLLSVTEKRFVNRRWQTLFPVVLKIAPRNKIEREEQRYDQFVRGYLKGMRHTYLEKVELRWQIGGIVYSLLGTSEELIEPFAKIYAKYVNAPKGEQTEKTRIDVTKILKSVFDDAWSKHYLNSVDPPDVVPLIDRYAEVWGIDWDAVLAPLTERATLDALPNPAVWVLQNGRGYVPRDTKIAITHGDLHPDNILIDEHNIVWLIDFERTGYGPILQDFAELEFNLVTRLDFLPDSTQDDDLLYDLYLALAAPRKPDDIILSPRSFLMLPDEHPYRKTVEAINLLRGLANNVSHFTDIREYLWGTLLNALYVNTRPMPSKHPEREDTRRQRAWLLASILCARLDKWRNLNQPPAIWPPPSKDKASFDGQWATNAYQIEQSTGHESAFDPPSTDSDPAKLQSTSLTAGSYALLIGVGKTPNDSRLSLPTTVKDAEQLKTVLLDQSAARFPASNVRMLCNETASLLQIQNELKWLADEATANPDSTVIVYFSGHGGRLQHSQDYFLVPSDIDPGRLNDTVLWSSKFTELLRAIKAKRLLVLIDACHAAGMASSKESSLLREHGFIEAPPPESLLREWKQMPTGGAKQADAMPRQGEGRAVISSCGSNQSSYIRKDGTLSIFTYHLREALTGQASDPGESHLTVSKLFEYLSKSVEKSAWDEHGKEQFPWGEFASQNFQVVRVPKVKPAPSPQPVMDSGADPKLPVLKTTRPITLFYSYSHKDERLRDQLEKHLSILNRNGVIANWHDRRITAGDEWKDKINENLNSADIILLLVSADFLASDYCYDKEMGRAMERYHAGDARVIPVFLKPVDWQGSPFGILQGLPTDARPVTKWSNRDAAFENIAAGIRKVANELQGRASA